MPGNSVSPRAAWVDGNREETGGDERRAQEAEFQDKMWRSQSASLTLGTREEKVDPGWPVWLSTIRTMPDTKPLCPKSRTSGNRWLFMSSVHRIAGQAPMHA